MKHCKHLQFCSVVSQVKLTLNFGFKKTKINLVTKLYWKHSQFFRIYIFLQTALFHNCFEIFQTGQAFFFTYKSIDRHYWVAYVHARHYYFLLLTLTSDVPGYEVGRFDALLPSSSVLNIFSYRKSHNIKATWAVERVCFTSQWMVYLGSFVSNMLISTVEFLVVINFVIWTQWEKK